MMLTFSIFAVQTVEAAGTKSISYVDAAGKDMGTQECQPVTKNMTTGWYYVTPDYSSWIMAFEDRIEVSGNVNLILVDNTLLNAKSGIHVPAGSSLTIWAQKTGNRKGKLEAINREYCNAGIGGNKLAFGGKITINGGEILAKGSKWTDESMKGGGPGISGNVVTINGGNITSFGKGRGSGNEAVGAGITGDEIVINGGNVNARGGYSGGAGIGGIGERLEQGGLRLSGSAVQQQGQRDTCAEG